MAAPRAGRKRSTSSSDGSVNERLARLEERVEGVLRYVQERFAVYERWFDELLDWPIKITKWTAGEVPPHPYTLKRTKKGAKQAAEIASKASAKARNTDERDKYIASCANPLLASGDYANDDGVIKHLIHPKTPWPEKKYGKRPESHDRWKRIFARLRKDGLMEPARPGRRKIVVTSRRS
jgi:hypothetical protein